MNALVDFELRDRGWFARKRAHTDLPKLHRMIDYMERLGERLQAGEKRAWVLDRYRALEGFIELNIPVDDSFLS